MEKVFLIAKFNELTKKLYHMLSSDFDIRLGSDKIYVILGIMEIERPDFILISLKDLDSWHTNIFMKINESYPDIPVLCYGTAAEQEPFKIPADTYGFHCMEPTPDKAVLTAAIQDILDGAGMENMDAAASDGNDVNTALLGTAAGNGAKKTILLVDDDPVQLRAVRALLQDRYKVLMSTSGTEALILLGKQVPDMIFLDYNMPVCDGRQTLKMIREFEPAKNIPVVFLTGIGDKAHIEMVLKLNPAGYLLKPVKQETLFDIIAEVLG